MTQVYFTFNAEINHSSENRVLALEQLSDGEEAFSRLSCPKGLTLWKERKIFEKNVKAYKMTEIRDTCKAIGNPLDTILACIIED